MIFDVACPIDGRVEVPSGSIALVIDPVNESRSTYTFPCPRCRVNVVKPATESVVVLLLRGGVRPMVKVCPPRFTGPALELEDLRDFTAALAATDYLTDLIGA